LRLLVAQVSRLLEGYLAVNVGLERNLSLGSKAASGEQKKVGCRILLRSYWPMPSLTQPCHQSAASA